jgi:hypothetical protein
VSLIFETKINIPTILMNCETSELDETQVRSFNSDKGALSLDKRCQILFDQAELLGLSHRILRCSADWVRSKPDFR